MSKPKEETDSSISSDQSPQEEGIWSRVWPWTSSAITLSVVIAAFWLLYHEFKTVEWQDVVDSFHSLPYSVVVAAILLTAINYLIMIGYDWLGVRLVHHPVGLRQIATASTLSFAFGNSLGMFFGATPIRFRLYTGWGMSPQEIVRLIFFVSLAFWIGLFSIAGLFFVVSPFELPARFNLPIGTSRPIGAIMLVLAAAYFSACAFRRQPLHLFGVNFQPPPLGIGLAQAMVAGFDFLFAAGTLYVLMPQEATIGFLPFVSIYLLAIILALVSNVPGGLGVLELVLITMLPPSAHSLVASLLAYRVIYYLLPLLLAIVGLGTGSIRELVANRWSKARAETR